MRTMRGPGFLRAILRPALGFLSDRTEAATAVIDLASPDAAGICAKACRAEAEAPTAGGISTGGGATCAVCI